MFLPFLMHVPWKTRCIQVDRIKILVVFVHGIHKQKEYCLTVAWILTSKYQCRIDDECKLIAYPTWQMYWWKLLGITTFSCNVESTRLRHDLAKLGGKNYSWRISTILVPFLVSSSCCHPCLPLVVGPMMTMQEMSLKIVFGSPEFNHSIVFSLYSCMSKKMNLFLEIEYSPGSTSVQNLSPVGIVLVEKIVVK